jgi:hypothetical protein
MLVQGEKALCKAACAQADGEDGGAHAKTAAMGEPAAER